MKLEDIPRQNNFKAPDGYFDSLPNRIASRIAAKNQSKQPVFLRLRLQYIVPALVLMIGLWWFIPGQQQPTSESMLASIETADLVAYLTEAELTSEELLDDVEYTSSDVEELEMELYRLQLDNSSIDKALDEIDSDSI